MFAVAKLTVVAKNNEAIEAEGLAEPLVCVTQDPWVAGCLFESLGSTDSMVSGSSRGTLMKALSPKKIDI